MWKYQFLDGQLSVGIAGKRQKWRRNGSFGLFLSCFGLFGDVFFSLKINMSILGGAGWG